jgi:lipid A 3-O-deacylase
METGVKVNWFRNILLPQRPARVLAAVILLSAMLLSGAGPARAADLPAPRAESQAAAANAQDARLPTQYGMAAEYSYSFDPSPHMSSLLARFSAVYDYASVWHQPKAPNTLRFKVEGAVGSNVDPGADLIASINMLALKYPLGLNRTVRPYGEAGIGIIYTEHRVKGQGLHVNFNPVLGAGLELTQQDGKNWFTALRLYHLSNAMLNHNNRGVNSIAIQAGRFF